MTTFGWKRKAGEGVVRKASVAFEESAKDEELDNEVTRGEVDWLTLAPKKRLISLEDAKAKSRRLRDEGGTLAEAERWELRCKAEDRHYKEEAKNNYADVQNPDIKKTLRTFDDIKVGQI